MLTVHQLCKNYDSDPILKDISFTVNRGDHIGLIGPNGSGKSTLLRILVGIEQADSGHLALSPADLRIGYLPQGFEPDPDLTVAEIIHEAAGDPDALEQTLSDLAVALTAEPDREALQIAYDRTLERLTTLDTGKTATILAALGLADVDDGRLAGTLSGGQKTRLALALVLLSEPQLLLLDEPTNHLDIEMLEWLEEWLARFSGGVLIVSHDRTFLDRSVNGILDLDPENQSVREYSGNYTDYLEQFIAERDRQMDSYRDQAYEIQRMKQDIHRTKEQALGVERSTTPRQPTIRRYAKKVARKAKSREKKLDRYLSSSDRVDKPKQGWQMKLEFSEAPHLGQDVLTLDNLTVGYPGHRPLLQQVNAEIRTGQRIVLAGPNGAGKTTLLRTLTGRLPPQAGRFRLGASVRLGYLAQEQEMLDPGLSALQTIQQVAPLNETDVRSFLHYFLFSDDEPLRPVGQLSYGERSRLGLALLVAGGCNFLLLDEPINHLDIPSRTHFEQALDQFEGTILAVVHDRYFIDRFAGEIWFVENQGLRIELR